MTKLCTSCDTQSEFEFVNGNNYKCMRCNAILHKCNGQDCNYMISHGQLCKKCISRGVKKSRSGPILTALAIVGAMAIAILKGSGDKKD